MRRLTLLVALPMALAAAPAALAQPPADAGPGTAGTAAPPAAHSGGTLHLTHACVTADADAAGVEVRALSANRHMRRALGGGDTFTARIGDATSVELVGRSRHLPGDGMSGPAPRTGDHSDLAAGDRVTVWIRDARATAAGELAPAVRVMDHGPSTRCAPPAEDPPDEPLPSL